METHNTRTVSELRAECYILAQGWELHEKKKRGEQLDEYEDAKLDLGLFLRGVVLGKGKD